MATIIGRNAKVALSDTDSSYTEIAKISGATLSITDDVADETNNDSAGYKEGKLSDQQLTLDVDFFYNSADAGQLELINAKNAKTVKFFRFRPEASSGEQEWRFQALITDLTLETSTSDVQASSFSVESTGTPVTGTQP